MNILTLPNGEEIYSIDKLTALYVYNEIFVENEYLRHGIEVKNGDIIFDVGANIGLFSRYIAKQASNLKIYTFEPIPVIYQVLEKNLEHISAAIKNYNIGLGDKSEYIEFFYYPKVSADSAAISFDWDLKVNLYVQNYKEAVCKDIPIARIVPKFLRKRVVRAGLKKIYENEKIICQIRPLSEIMREEKVNRIDLLKIDAENYESQVLAGISEHDWEKIQQLSMEVHEHIKGGENLLNKIIELVENKGFEVNVGDESLSTRLGVYMVYAKKK